MTNSIIDIGSNSVRLMVVANGFVIVREKITSRLGKDMSDGRLDENSILRTVKALGRLCATATENGCSKQDIYAFATAAVRNSVNADEFLTLAEAVLGKPVEVISGEAEGELALSGVLGESDGAVLDIGGASSELTVKKDGKIIYSHSLKVGAVVLYDACGSDKDKLSEYVDRAVKEYDVSLTDRLFVVGGTATSLAYMDIGGEYSRDKTHLHELTLEALTKLTERLFRMTDVEIEKTFGVTAERSEIIRGGAVLLIGVMKRLGCFSVTVSENDNLEGYYRKKFSQSVGEKNECKN
ncbi:MAG: hypothetical protein ACI4M6_04270 [Christensenellaceae bacterium]